MDLNTMIAESRLGSDFPLPTDLPFTLGMAKEAGISRRELERLTTEGVLRRPVRSVYVGSELGDSLMLRAQCLRLVVPPDAVIVDRHAGWLHGAPMVLQPNEHLELKPVSMFLPAGNGRIRRDIADSGERHFRPGDVVEVDGLAVTSPLRTAWDLGRVRWPDESIAGMDAMLRLGLFERARLVSGGERFRRMRWVTTLRAILPLVDGRSESPGESVLRLRCIEARLFMVPQVEVHHQDGVLIGRLDLAEEALMIAAEYDGHEWHGSPAQQEHDAERRERIRDQGWLVQAFTKTEVFGRSRDCGPMLHALAREARQRRGDAVRW